MVALEEGVYEVIRLNVTHVNGINTTESHRKVNAVLAGECRWAEIKVLSLKQPCVIASRQRFI